VKLGTIVKHISARAHNYGFGPALMLSYDAAIAIARYWILDQCDGVVSLYVRRSFASGDAIPGQSDIDLCAICSSSISDVQIETIRKQYARLSFLLPVFPKDELEIHTTDDVDNILSRRSHLNVSLLVGVRAWKHIAGLDIFQSDTIKDLGDPLICHYEELKIWVAHLYSDLFEIETRDLISRRHLWFKVLAETLKFHAVVKEDAPPSRPEALLRYRHNHNEYSNYSHAWESAIEMRDNTFSSGELPPDQDRYNLCSAIIVNALDDLEEKLVLADEEKISFETELSVNDLQISNSSIDIIGEITRTLLYWGITDIRIAVRTFVGLDDLVLLLSPPDDFSVKEFKHINVYLNDISSPQNILAYLRHGRSVATCVFPISPKNPDNVLICTLSDPMVFKSSLKSDEVLCNGALSQDNNRIVHSYFLPKPFSTEWKNNVRCDYEWIVNCISTGEPLSWDVIRFHRFFWKALQIWSFASFDITKTDHYNISITSKQILAKTKAAFMEHEEFLDEFYGSYVRALNDEVSSTIEHYETALKILSSVF
jgi:predicted nucleotidyltransferase